MSNSTENPPTHAASDRVQTLQGVGDVYTDRLNELGIRTVEDLARV